MFYVDCIAGVCTFQKGVLPRLGYPAYRQAPYQQSGYRGKADPGGSSGGGDDGASDTSDGGGSQKVGDNRATAALRAM